jgi:hypothetical protein
MRSLLAGLTGLPFVAGVALAAQPVPLSDTQMEAVIAGASAGPCPGGEATCAISGVFFTFCPCPPPPPPPGAPPSVQFSYILTINGISLQVPQVRQ